VNDTKLNACFLQEWEQAIQAALVYSSSHLPKVCEYIDAKDHKEKATIRPALKTLFPDHNLDQPDPKFSLASLDPGNFDADCIIFEMTPLGAPKKKGVHYPAYTQKFPIQNLVKNGFNGAKTGKVIINYDFKDYKTEFAARVKLRNRAKFEGYDYLEYLSQYDGKKQGQIGRVLLGDIFYSEFTIPSKFVGKKFKRVYLLLPENQTLEPMDTLLIGSGMEIDKFRIDVASMDEKIEGNRVSVNLQVTDVNSQKHVGRCKVVMVCLDGDTGDIGLNKLMEDSVKDLEAAMESMEALDEAMDLTEEEEAELGAKMEAYEAELLKKGDLSEEEIDQMMMAKAQELMKELGKDVEEIMNESAGVKHLEETQETPFYAANTIDVRPVRLSIETPIGWKVFNGDKTMGSLNKALVKKTKGNYSYFVAGGNLNIFFMNDPEQFQARKKEIRKHELAIPIRLSKFDGWAFETSKEDKKEWAADNSDLSKDEDPDLSSGCDYTYSINGEGVLKKGGLIMSINYSYFCTGKRSTDKKGNVLYDGLPAARDEVKNMKSEIDRMLNKFQLVEDK